MKLSKAEKQWLNDKVAQRRAKAARRIEGYTATFKEAAKGTDLSHGSIRLRVLRYLEDFPDATIEQGIEWAVKQPKRGKGAGSGKRFQTS